MITGGISCIGSYHEINQDYCICSSVGDGFVLVLSDGVGSKKYSQMGSKFICEIICKEFEHEDKKLRDIHWETFLKKCHLKWVDSLIEFDVNQCYATMLVLIVQNDHLKAARLGDGFLSIMIDKQIHILMDRKAEYFANETDCLTPMFDTEHLEVFEADFDRFAGAIACSDGIEIGTMRSVDITAFTRDFLFEYSKVTAEESASEILGWVSEWPGIDDKTIAYLISEVSEV